MRYIFVLSVFLSAYLFGDSVRQIEIDALQRSYIVHVPDNLSRNGEVPLVIFLHGAGGNAVGASHHYGWEELADKEGFIVAFLDATPFDLSKPENFISNPSVWNDGSGRGGKSNIDDLGFIRKVIEILSNDYRVDSRRIYISGFSNGASMTFRAGIELSEIVAGIGPVMGQLYVKNPKSQNLVYLYYIAGEKDPLNPIDGGLAPNPWTNREHPSEPMIHSLNEWLKMSGIDPKPVKEFKSSGVEITDYGKNNEAVYTIVFGQGHQWPGSKWTIPEQVAGKNSSQWNATKALWNYFKSHPKKL